MTDEPASNPGNEPHSFFQNFQHTPVGARVPEKVGRGVLSTAIMILQTNELFVLDFLSMMVQPKQVVARVVMTANSFSQFFAALQHNVANYESQIGPLMPRGLPALPPGAAPIIVSPPPFEPPLVEPSAGQPPVAQPPMGGSPAGESSAAEAPAVREAPRAEAPPPPHGSHASTPFSPEEGGPASITELYEQLKFPEDLLGGVFANAVMIRHTPEEFCFDFISNLYPRPVVASRVFTAAGRIPSVLVAMNGSLGRYRQGGSPPGPAVPESPSDE